MFDRAKKALGLSKEKAPPPAMTMDFMEMEEAASPAPSPAVDRLVSQGAPAGEAQSIGASKAVSGGEEIGAMFARQLASGLWEGGNGSNEDQLGATTACLVRCAKEGVDTSNPIYGAQVTKAVEALSALAESLLGKASDETIVRALLAMVAVSSGKRARGRVAAIAQSAASATVKAVAADLASQDAAKARLG